MCFLKKSEIYDSAYSYYLFLVKVDRYVDSCNTLNDLSNKVCAPNKMKDSNLSVFSMIAGINACEILTKHISCHWKCRFDERKYKSDHWWNNDKCQCECEKCHSFKKGYAWDPAPCNCENWKHLASIMDDSLIVLDEITDADSKISRTNFGEKQLACKTQNFYILLAFLSIAVALLIAIYYYLIKDPAQEKNYDHLTWQITN